MCALCWHPICILCQLISPKKASNFQAYSGFFSNQNANCKNAPLKIRTCFFLSISTLFSVSRFSPIFDKNSLKLNGSVHKLWRQHFSSAFCWLLSGFCDVVKIQWSVINSDEKVSEKQSMIEETSRSILEHCIEQ